MLLSLKTEAVGCFYVTTLELAATKGLYKFWFTVVALPSLEFCLDFLALGGIVA